MVLLYCNHCNLTLKLHRKNSYLNEGRIFIGRFKVGSFPRMTNKEVLGYTCEPTKSTEKLFPMKKLEIYNSSYVH